MKQYTLFKRLLLLPLLFILYIQAQGATFQSGYITYKILGSTNLSFTYRIITNAADSNLTANDFTSFLSCQSTSTSVPITNINKTKTTKLYHNCNLLDFSWDYTFNVNIDLSSSHYASLSSCCDFIVDFTGSSRESDITTLTNTSNSFYVYSTIKTCNINYNEGPESNFNYYANNCLNQPCFINLGSYDTSNFDSLSFKLVTPLSTAGMPVGFISGLSASFPHYAYYPGQITPPYVNSSSSPPIGFFLSQSTGDIIYTPVEDSSKGPVSIEISEWRKDNTGTYIKIGTIHRELLIETVACNMNNPPSVDGPYAYSVCAGDQICFNVTTNDVVFTPPPPAQSPPPDSVKNSWNHGIPSATYTIINPTARLQTGQFCWTPRIDQASDLPYTFTVTARDNACPLNAVSSRSFRVKVNQPAQTDRTITKISDSLVFVQSSLNADFRGNPSYRWEILDSNLINITNNNIVKFNSSGTALSFKQQDTIRFYKSGFYIIQLTINNLPLNCPTVYYDTVYFNAASFQAVSETPIQIFPNPASNQINLSLLLDDVTIYSSDGKELLHAKNANELNLDNISSGLYFLIGKKKNTIYHGKFIKY